MQQVDTILNKIERIAGQLTKKMPPYFDMAKSLQIQEPPSPPAASLPPGDTSKAKKVFYPHGDNPSPNADLSLVQPTKEDKALLHAPALPPATSAPISFALWEALAYDLALANTDEDTLCQAYDITPQSLANLKENTFFAKMLAAKKEEVAQLGTDAAFAVKMRMIANQATPQFLKRLVSPSTPTKEFHTLFKTAVELAQLLPQPQEDQSTTPVIGASVTFNIQGVPGLDHLASIKTTADTLTAMQSAPQADVIDVESKPSIATSTTPVCSATTQELTEL